MTLPIQLSLRALFAAVLFTAQQSPRNTSPICECDWLLVASQSGTTPISSPNNSVLVISRVLVYSDSDLPTSYNLAKQIQLTPLSQ